MKNPWEEIPLEHYENHMKLDSVMQLQVLNRIMKEQFYKYNINTIMILGVAGGNGLEHINPEIIHKVFGVDVNKEYLKECEIRYPKLRGIFEGYCINLIDENILLPNANLVIANLLIEYIGYSCFKKAICKIKPEYVSCVIQVNNDDDFVSESPYAYVFDNLSDIHHQMYEEELIDIMKSIEYYFVFKKEYYLPNGKKLIRVDFKC